MNHEDKINRIDKNILTLTADIGRLTTQVAVLHSEVSNLKVTGGRWESAVIATIVSGVAGGIMMLSR